VSARLCQERLHVVGRVVPHGALAGSVRVVSGHRRRPDAEDALERTAPAAPDLRLRHLLAERIAVEVAVRVDRVVIRKRRLVHFLERQQIEVDDAIGALEHLCDALLVLATRAGVDRCRLQQLYAQRSYRPGDDDAALWRDPLDLCDDLPVVLPARRGRLDHDVIELLPAEIRIVALVRFTQRNAVAEGDVGARRLGHISRGIAHEERIGLRVAVVGEVRRGVYEKREWPARAGACTRRIHEEAPSRSLIDAGLYLAPPGRIAE
jgi:hypothetical protein